MGMGLNTLPTTNSLHLKMVVPNRNLLFQWSIFRGPIFRGHVGFREGKIQETVFENKKSWNMFFFVDVGLGVVLKMVNMFQFYSGKIFKERWISLKMVKHFESGSNSNMQQKKLHEIHNLTIC